MLSRQPQLPLPCSKPLHGGRTAPPTPPSTAGPQSSRARVRADGASGRLCAALPSHSSARPGPAPAGSPVLQRRRLRVTGPGAGRVDPGEDGDGHPGRAQPEPPLGDSSPGTFGDPGKVCSCLSLITLLGGALRPRTNPVPTEAAPLRRWEHFVLPLSS